MDDSGWTSKEWAIFARTLCIFSLIATIAFALFRGVFTGIVFDPVSLGTIFTTSIATALAFGWFDNDGRKQ